MPKDRGIFSGNVFGDALFAGISGICEKSSSGKGAQKGFKVAYSVPEKLSDIGKSRPTSRRITSLRALEETAAVLLHFEKDPIRWDTEAFGRPNPSPDMAP